MHIIEVGDPPQYIQLSETAHCIFYKRNIGCSFDQISEEVYSRTGQLKSPADIEFAYLKIESDIKAIKNKGVQQQKTFWFQRSLISSKIVQLVASRMSHLFKIQTVCLGVILIILSAIITLAKVRNADFLSLSMFNSFIYFLISLLIHEIGHASACKRYEVAPSEIGFGIYFIWPALYCNVNGVWALNKWQRIVVDIGGIYFQLLTACLYLLCYLITQEIALLNAILLIFSSCIFYLNPFLKFDGYWIVSDFLGIINLDRQPSKVLKYYISLLLKKPTKPLPWKKSKQYLLILYSISYLIFWVSLSYSLIFSVLNRILHP
jgi:putative peptide zinc metalloprotease protein